jgi:DNA-binding IclR family transcriptional regulator
MSAPTPAIKPLPAPVVRTCELFRLLAGNELHGLAPAQIAKALKVSPSWVSITLPGLAELGFLERIEASGRWRLGPAFVRIAHTVSANLAAAKRDLDNLQQRYSTPL